MMEFSRATPQTSRVIKAFLMGTFIWEPTRHRESLFNRNGVNAGGGQSSNFVNEVGTNQGAGTGGRSQPPATRSATLLPVGPARDAAATAPATATAPGRGRGNGGRYETNELFEIYPLLQKKYQAK